MPRASRRRSRATAEHPRTRCSELFSVSWVCGTCPNRPTWPMPWPWRCAIITRRDCRVEEPMITKITGVVNRVLEEEVRLQVGPLEYQILVPDFVRRQIQLSAGQELTLHTSQYLEGNPMQGRMVPRLIGFLTEAELEFFELFCTV